MVSGAEPTFEPAERWAGIALGAFTLVKTAASLGPGVHVAPSAAYIGALWVVMAGPPADRPRDRWLAIGGLLVLGLISMMTSHNEALLMVMPVLPVAALHVGLGAAAGAAAVLVVVTAAVSAAHGDSPSDAVQWAASAVGGVLFLLGFSRLLVREREGRRALAREVQVSAALAAATERHRIAADLHDGLGHHLSAALIQLEAARAVGGEGGPAAPFLARASDSLRGAMDDVRGALHLHEAPRRGEGLVAALEDLIRTSGEAGLPVAPVDIDVPPGGRPLSPDAEIALWRGAQEALTNARRHAGARQATLELRADAASLTLTVTDDGAGLRGATEGRGLRGMRERLRAVGGDAAVTEPAGGGVAVRLWVPR